MKEQNETSALVGTAANVSVAAPLIAFALFQGAIFAARVGAKWPLSSSWVIMIVSGILIISGLVGGIVALCGIPRHGARRLLWRGLVGVLAFAGVVAVSVVDLFRIAGDVAR